MKPSRLSHFVTSLTRSAASFTTTAGEHGPLVTAGRSPLRLAGILSLSAVTLIGTHSAQAGGATRIWDGSTSNNWNTNTNWGGNTLPSATNDTASFTGTFGIGGAAITLGGNQTTGTLSISTTTVFSISDNTLSVDDGITRSATTGTTTINSGILLLNDNAWNIAGNSTAGTLIVNGIINDGASTFNLVKSGTGRLVLNNANTFNGIMQLDAGVLVLGNNTAAGSGTLDLVAGTIEGANGTRTISNNLTIANNITFGGGELIFTDSFDQGGGRTYIVNNTTTFSGSLSGSDNLTKSGTGTLILSGDNSLGTNIDTVTVNTGGALRVANNGALGGTGFGTVVDTGGALELIGNRTIGAEALTLDGTGVSNGGGLRNISGNNSWAGLITINSATRINSDAGLLTLDVTSGNAINGTADNLTFGGAGDTTVADAIATTTGTLTKDGSGKLTLSAANTYTGTTTIQAGSLVVGAAALSGSAGALGNATSAVVLGNGSTLVGDAPSLLINGAFTVARAITVGSVTNTAAYNATIGGSNTTGTSTFSGNITLNNTATNYTTTLQAAANGTVDFTTGTWATNNRAITIGSSGNTGTVKLSNTLATTGGISVNFGTLLLGASDRLGDTTPVTVAGGIFDTGTALTDTVSVFNMSSGSLNGTGTITAATYNLSGGTVTGNLGAGTMNVTTGTVNLNGLSGSLAVNINSGTLALGANDRLANTATVAVAGGILAVAGNSDTVGAVSLTSGSITGSGGTLTGSSYAVQSGSISAKLGGSGVALTKTTGGTTILSAANTYTGDTLIKAGTLELSIANAIASTNIIVGDTGSSGATLDATAAGLSVGASQRVSGIGTIKGSSTIQGILAPGDSVSATGTLTLDTSGAAAVTMDSSGGFELLLAGAGALITAPGSSDMLTIAGAAAGDFTFSGNNVNFLNTGAVGFYKVFDTSSDNANTWTGLTFDGTTGLVSAGLTYSNLTSGLTGDFYVGTTSNSGTTGDIYFQVVPEPGAALLGGLGTLLLLRRRRTA